MGVAEGATRQSWADDPLLAFIHVPKTGGTSLQVLLEDPVRNARRVFNIVHPDDVATFLAMPQVEQAGYFGVFGHMPFGIDRHVSRPVTYITILRNPVERVLSAYAHILRQEDHRGRSEALRMGIGWTARPGNLQVTHMADYAITRPPDGAGRFWWDDAAVRSRQEYLAQAKANLERCAFVGLTENYEDDIRALRKLKDHPLHVPSTPPHEMRGGERLGVADLSAEQIEAIRFGNRLDMELYDHALRLRDHWKGPLRPSNLSGPPPERTLHTMPLSDRGFPAPRPAWRALPLVIHDHIGGRDHVGLPLLVHTPALAWDYGATSDVIEVDGDASVRVRARALRGVIGLCLVAEDFGKIISVPHSIIPEDGMATVVIDFKPGDQSGRLLVRNHGDDGNEGEAIIEAVEIRA